jgi:predicted nicotinamide N-methyase
MILDTPDHEAFIRQNTRLFAVPHAPEISLHMADEATALWQSTEDELGEIGLPPPFWAFAWAGGQALARYVIDNPSLVRGRRVLDFASGSGLVAIAAARAGAAHVEAADIDVFAAAAIQLNARVNAVESIITTVLADVIDHDGPWDIVLAGDICYQRDVAERVIAWLMRLHEQGTTVLIGDPGRSYLPREALIAVASYQVPTTRALEDMEIKNSSVWRFKAGGMR